MTDGEFSLNIALCLEKHLITWDEIDWKQVPKRMRKYRHEDIGPIGVGYHPKFGWFVLASGQGPFLVTSEAKYEDLVSAFKAGEFKGDNSILNALEEEE